MFMSIYSLSRTRCERSPYHGCLSSTRVWPDQVLENLQQTAQRGAGQRVRCQQPPPGRDPRPSPRRTHRGTHQREEQHVQTRPRIRRNRTTREQKSRVGWLPTCAEAMLQKPVHQAGGAQPAAAQSRKAEVAAVGGGGGDRGAVWRWTGRRACKRHS